MMTESMSRLFKRGLIVGGLAICLVAGIVPRVSATTAYTVTLLKLECIDRQDPWPDNNDEPQISVNAMPSYEGSGYDDGTVKNFKNVDVTVYDDFVLSIWELDTPTWLDPNDYLGYTTITSSSVVGLGSQTAIIGSSGYGKYKIYYKVEYK